MGHLEFVYQALDAGCLFQWIQVFALDILDERHSQGRFVRNLANDYWHLRKSGELRSPPAAFAGDDFIFAVVTRAYQDWLNQALGLDRSGQVGNGLRIHPRTGLKSSRR